MQPTDGPANLGDSIIFAKDLLANSEKNKEIYAISDYAQGQGIDVGLAGKVAANEGISGQKFKVGKSASNTGLVEIEAKRYLTNINRFYLTATLKNYDPEDVRVKGEICLDGEKIDEINIQIPSKGTKLIHYDGALSKEKQSAFDRAAILAGAGKARQVLAIIEEELEECQKNT